ncbi:MAG: hypothetical protein RLZZ352_962 [Pseudomonadota bacterium]
MITFVVAATWIALCRTCFLQLNLRLYPITYGFYFNFYCYTGNGYNSKVMHSINIMTFVTGQPAFSTRYTKLTLKMNFGDRTFQGDF